MAGIVVTVDGRSAPLRFVGKDVIVFIVPRLMARTGRSRVVVRVISPNAVIEKEVRYVAASPGLLCYGQLKNECFPQAIYHMIGEAPFLISSDYPLSLSRYDREARVQIVGTGFRATKKDLAELTLCGQRLEIVYVGKYPGIDGLDCVTFILPKALPDRCPSMQQPIVLTVNGKSSNSVWLNLRNN